jgi:ketosteroid isomerase-like protein
MIRSLGVVGLVAALSGCASAPPPPPVVPRTVMSEEARAHFETVLGDQYAALEKGDLDAWAEAFAPDVFFFGARAHDALSSKEAIVEAWKRELEPAFKAGKKLSIKSTQLQIGLASDGRAAWVSDVVEITFGEISETQRITEVIGEQDGEYWVYALHWSMGVPADQARARARDPKAKPRELTESIAPGAQAVVGEFEKAVLKAGELLQGLSRRPDTVLFGTTPDENFVGNEKIHQQLALEIREGLTITRRGPVCAGVTPNGKIGWVASNVDLGTAGSPPVKVPARGLLVYLNEGGLWRLVQGHLSTAVP